MKTKISRLERIAAHGQKLLAIFPGATEQDPVKLCKKLRRLESKAHEIAMRLCNGPEFPGGYDQVDQLCNVILKKVNRLLNNIVGVPIRINRDPRGYALKILDTWMAYTHVTLHQDIGGYGIIAPEIS